MYTTLHLILLKQQIESIDAKVTYLCKLNNYREQVEILKKIVSELDAKYIELDAELTKVKLQLSVKRSQGESNTQQLD